VPKAQPKFFGLHTSKKFNFQLREIGEVPENGARNVACVKGGSG